MFFSPLERAVFQTFTQGEAMNRDEEYHYLQESEKDQEPVKMSFFDWVIAIIFLAFLGGGKR